jgi:predicted RNA-binding protein with PIN domain
MNHFADGASYKGIRIFYAHRGSDADERIKQHVEDSRERSTLIVVTSDRALGDYIRRCGAKLVRSGEFRKMMDGALNDSTEAARGASESKADDLKTSEWMRFFGVDSTDDDF